MSRTIAIISDIHSNPAALDAVLDRLEKDPPDTIYCLGDVVGYGPDPNESAAKLRRIAEGNIVMGNHDLGITKAHPGYLALFNPDARAAAYYQISVLTPENHAWLASLPFNFEKENCLFCHGSPFDTSHYLRYAEEFLACYEAVKDSGVRVVFFGHTHIPVMVGITPSEDLSVSDLHSNAARSDEYYVLDSDKVYFVNPGSVGQPRDQIPSAAYLLYFPDEGLIQFRRAVYDYSETQRRMLSAGLPRFLAERLAVGI